MGRKLGISPTDRHFETARVGGSSRVRAVVDKEPKSLSKATSLTSPWLLKQPQNKQEMVPAKPYRLPSHFKQCL